MTYANGGTEWAPAGEPERVQVHDFTDRALGEFAKAIPYGIYDVANDEGWVSVGDVDLDTAEFRGRVDPPLVVRHGPRPVSCPPDRLLVTADAGGSNGYRVRALEVPPRCPRGRDRAAHHRVPLSARHVEVEPDRTPDVQLHHDELAGSPPYEPADHIVQSSSPPPPPTPVSACKPNSTPPPTQPV